MPRPHGSPPHCPPSHLAHEGRPLSPLLKLGLLGGRAALQQFEAAELTRAKMPRVRLASVPEVTPRPLNQGLESLVAPKDPARRVM